LEEKPKSQEKLDGEGQIFPDRWQGPNVGGGEAEEETEDGREDDEVAKKSSEHKEEGGDQDIRIDILLFPLIEAGGDKSPELVENEGRGEKDPGQQGGLEISEESLRDGRKDQGTPRRKHPDQGAHQNFHDLFYVGVRNGKSDADPAEGINEPLAQFLQVRG